MKKITPIIICLLLNFISCKHNVKDDFEVDINQANVFFENNEYFAIVSGTITNSTKNYLNKLTLSTHIAAEKVSGDFAIVDCPDFEVLINGEELKAGEKKSFSVKLPFLKFNRNQLKDNYKNAHIKFFVEGENGVGFRSRDDQEQEYFENWPEYDITKSWQTLIEK